MNAARRSRRKLDWPRGLYEPRPGYFVWRHPDGRTLPLGRVPLADARNEALAANAHVAETAPSLVERLTGEDKTMGDVIDAMPTPANANSAKSARSLDKRIRAKLGGVLCIRLSVRDCSDLVDEVLAEGKERTAEAVRSRLTVLCAKAMARGWMETNPAEATERPDVVVRRSRLTLEAFWKIYEKAPEVNEWLQLVMRLAIVTGQDRSTISDMERTHIVDEHLTVWRTKTRETNQAVDIPLALRLDVVGWSLAELVKRRTGVISRYLVHHVRPWGNAPAGSQVFVDAMSKAFTEARKLAGIPDVMLDGKLAPTLHEIRSLSKRLYLKQGGVDTKALLGHKTESASDLYADPRGVEHIRVRVA